jgi:MFS family permease
MTDNQRVLSRRYLLYKFFANLWFVGAVWLYFYRIYINDQQVGILDGMAFAIGLVAEVPSGALADKFGRDKLVKLGQLLMGSGFIIQALGSSFLPFFVGQAVLMIGASFTSGADEALFFDKLKFDKNSVDWRRLVTRSSQLTIIGSLAAYVAGGYLHTINPRIPWILTGLCFLISVVIIWQVKEIRSEKKKQTISEEIKQYLQDIKIGFSQFRLPSLLLYVPIIVSVQGLFYAYGWGLLRLVILDRFHFSPLWGSVAIASSSLITYGALAYMHKHAERISEKQVIVLISLSALASLLFSVANIGMWGYFVVLALYVGEHLMYPFMSEIINKVSPERQRATVLSVASFLRMWPYVVLAPVIGYLNTQNKLEYFLVGWSMLIGVAVVIYVLTKKRDVQIQLTDGI